MFVEVLLVRLDGDLSRLDDADNMDELMSVLNVKNFRKEVTAILVNLRSIFLSTSKML